MGQLESDAGTISESGNWNVAKPFSQVKIMDPLTRCEIYEDLAVFGYESFLEELINFNNMPNDIVRIKGLNRLVKELIKICKNTKFVMKKPGTRDTLQKLEDKLVEINKILPALYKKRFNQVNRTSDLVIIPDKFSYVLDKVIEIKSEINDPLNKNDLIFLNKEEYDPKSAKKAYIERLKTTS